MRVRARHMNKKVGDRCMNAITFGRYNIVTNAHLNTLEKILEKWPTVVIGIVAPTKKKNFHMDPSLANFYLECDKNNDKHSDYSIDERIEMWEKTIYAEGISDRVKVVRILRPEYFPAEFNHQFPPSKYQLVFPETLAEKNKFDTMRNDAFGIILEREVATVKPSLTLHFSDIRKHISDYTDWEKYVPIGCYSVLARLHEGR